MTRGFWVFVDRETKKELYIGLRNSASMSVISAKGKLESLKIHYRYIHKFMQCG